MQEALQSSPRHLNRYVALLLLLLHLFLFFFFLANGDGDINGSSEQQRRYWESGERESKKETLKKK